MHSMHGFRANCGIIARLRHFVPTSSLLKNYRSLIEPYISNGLMAWGQLIASCQFKSEQNSNIAKTSSTVNVLF